MSKRWMPNDVQLGQIETMAGIGLSEEKMAAILDISVSTFQLAHKKSAAMQQRLLKGRAMASSNVLSTAYEMAVSKMHPAMTIFWLKVREGWKDRSFVELNDVTKPETAESSAERRKRIAAKAKKLKILDECE